MLLINLIIYFRIKHILGAFILQLNLIECIFTTRVQSSLHNMLIHWYIINYISERCAFFLKELEAITFTVVLVHLLLKLSLPQEPNDQFFVGQICDQNPREFSCLLLSRPQRS